MYREGTREGEGREVVTLVMMMCDCSNFTYSNRGGIVSKRLSLAAAAAVRKVPLPCRFHLKVEARQRTVDTSF